MTHYSLPLRPRRLRKTATIRNMVQENWLRTEQFIAPLFISETLSEKRAIPSMPGLFQLTLNDLDKEIEEISALGLPAVLLFGIPAHKDSTGSSSLSDSGIIQQAIQKIRSINKDIVIIADVCFCEYTDHGHCGVMEGETLINDATLELLTSQAISYAKAGADWIAPSSNTDGMVGAIRDGLDNAGYEDVAILSYAVKYSSSFYGPFRQAAEGAPRYGNRKTYQMNPANGHEALREAALDIEEGADLLMVKPAMNYLDVIYRLKQNFPEVPCCAYQVSGEFSMIKAAAAQGLINEEEAMMESLLAIKRAGADLIISYFAKDVAKLLKISAP
ncbi:delta-aminolevulinic acid dehydratases (porphobilinogen synthase) (plasmid) [Legionella adelaidensis]|uniref:Delta-aminolevulinic acid dehydratase n=1 Tax=Legionella adelaidensis TaxID=45056 RepID=A0A0W0R3J3_9GAMM|nr:porphobilinogen synthase [Legionella adelaidensis]KTC65621.1 delta-aminolevulinic acid dehydratases (porphobilinogen synthase) [Legionella adelaidensis]VEH85182.1 delta-aminolevulinic acid dehydratases (porphobilinogen synthase) [Legionella adelaidensis]